MESYQHLIEIIALTMGVAWASGINLYAALFMLGYMGSSGQMVLPEPLLLLADPLVMAAAGFMYCVEFFADKVPGVDSGWDLIHTFIRIPAGAVLAAGVVGEVGPAAAVAAAIVGGGISAAAHATKAGGRVLINTSPEPVTNWTASIMEDVAVIAGLWTALHYPLLFLLLLFVTFMVMIWLLPRIWQGIKAIMVRLRRLFSQPAASGLQGGATGVTPPPIPDAIHLHRLQGGSTQSGSSPTKE